MRKTKEQKGITLVALIITIVVLLILAAVAINAITQYNIIDNAHSAAQKYEEKAGIENTILGKYDEETEKYIGGSNEESGLCTVSDIKNIMQISNTKVVDEYGNQIVVPAGFKIRVDADAGIKGDEKSTVTNVTQGIVIEDASGNQFVWVPVGKIYTNVEKTEFKTITLGRYAYDPDIGTNDYILNENGEYIPSANITINGRYDCIEETATETGLGQYGNVIARNIEEFVTSVNTNKGYYIGRFEAGKENNALVCKAGKTVYVEINQPASAKLCKKMYNEGADGYANGTFSSDLINSYAWDTAIIFIQTFCGENEYYKQNKSTSFKITGGNGEEYCNINDMSGNAFEYSTETARTSSPCVARGGYYGIGSGVNGYTSKSFNSMTSNTGSRLSFRPILYLATVEDVK